MTEVQTFSLPNRVLYRVTRAPLGIMAATFLFVSGLTVIWQARKEAERLQGDIVTLIADQQRAFANELFLHEERAIRTRLQATVDQVRARYPQVDVCIHLQAHNQEGFLPDPVLECRGEEAHQFWDKSPEAIRRQVVEVGEGISAEFAFAAHLNRSFRERVPLNFVIAIVVALLVATFVDSILVRRLQFGVVRPLLARIEMTSKLAGIGYTTAGLAHDIKDPLHNIKKIAAQHPITKDRQKSLQENVAEIESLIEQMLAFSRPAPNRGEVEPLDLAAETSRIVESFRTALKIRGLDTLVTVDLDEGQDAKNQRVAIGARELRRIVFNVLHNALSALTKVESNSAACIKISLKREGDLLRLDMANNGPPIPERELEAIFIPFFSTQKANGGTGLGLPIARKCATDVGGALTAENRDGWVQFTLTIPSLSREFAGGMT